LDLSSQKSVREAAADVLNWKNIPTMNILANNAAVMNLPERTLSEDGFEMQFATNQVGHFLSTCLIMPKLIKAAETSPRNGTRVINVTSLSPVVAGMSYSDINFNKINKILPEAG
jgi:NAD(P)-dependent dehydrogenase (short-subunit alcohol dehydrogenase family)